MSFNHCFFNSSLILTTSFDLFALVKLRKPQQDMRLDLPTIGLQTIENAHSSGLRGLAVHAGNALIVQEKEVIKLADKYKMFLIGINPAEYIS